MNLTDLRLEIRDLTSTDETTFTDTTLDRKINIEYKKLVIAIIQATGHTNDFVKQAYTDIKSVTSLVEGDLGYNGEYPLPVDCAVPLRVEVKKDETQIPLTVYDHTQNSLSEFVESDLNTLSNKMRFMRNSILIRPLPTENVTKGLYIEYVAIPSDLSAGTDSPDFLALFHDVLVLAVSNRYFLNHPEKDGTNIKEEFRIQRALMVDFFQDRMPQKKGVKGKREDWE